MKRSVGLYDFPSSLNDNFSSVLSWHNGWKMVEEFPVLVVSGRKNSHFTFFALAFCNLMFQLRFVLKF